LPACRKYECAHIVGFEESWRVDQSTNSLEWFKSVHRAVPQLIVSDTSVSHIFAHNHALGKVHSLALARRNAYPDHQLALGSSIGTRIFNAHTSHQLALGSSLGTRVLNGPADGAINYWYPFKVRPYSRRFSNKMTLITLTDCSRRPWFRTCL
jgi:hypothetical protein